MSDAEIKRLTYDEIIDLRNKRQQEEINKELEKIAEKVAKKIEYFICGLNWDPKIESGLKERLPLTMIEEYLSTQFTVQFKVQVLHGISGGKDTLYVDLCGGVNEHE